MFGLLNTLVVPALAYPEEVMQDLGLQCLGLICSLEKALAADNMELFLTCAFAENASTLLHVLSVKVSTSIMTFSTPCVQMHMRVQPSHNRFSHFSSQIMFDLILTFGMAPMSSQVGEERINADLKRALESEEPEVQAVAVEGISKLMLTKVLRDAEVKSNIVF